MERRIESKTSRTAEFTCLARGLSYLEKREQYHSDDNVSMVIMNGVIRPLMRLPMFKRLFLKKYPAGMYEYILARTKTIDAEFIRAQKDGFEQILIFGAGFDTRGIRFGNFSPNTRIFELDANVTQTAKIGRYYQKKIEIPKNLIFIPIDFDRESVSERLTESGFKKGLPSLFILEGLTMYLQPESVDGTFRVIEAFSGPNSRVVFDHIYASVLRRENLYEGEQALFESVQNSGESFHFGIEKGHAEEFLYRYGFSAEKILDAEALEKLFFCNSDGQCIGRVNQTHCIVTAVKNT